MELCFGFSYFKCWSFYYSTAGGGGGGRLDCLPFTHHLLHLQRGIVCRRSPPAILAGVFLRLPRGYVVSWRNVEKATVIVLMKRSTRGNPHKTSSGVIISPYVVDMGGG